MGLKNTRKQVQFKQPDMSQNGFSITIQPDIQYSSSIIVINLHAIFWMNRIEVLLNGYYFNTTLDTSMLTSILGLSGQHNVKRFLIIFLSSRII